MNRVAVNPPESPITAAMPQSSKAVVATHSQRISLLHDCPPGANTHGLKQNIILSRLPTPQRRRFYDQMVEEMKATHTISIRKWRKRMSGVAYELRYSNGDIKRMISSPRPRSPVSACIFLHEVGHHAIGFRKFRPRCLEEFYVWQWAFRQLRSYGIPMDTRVTRHYRRSMYHYVQLARKRGLKRLPAILEEFRIWPA